MAGSTVIVIFLWIGYDLSLPKVPRNLLQIKFWAQTLNCQNTLKLPNKWTTLLLISTRSLSTTIAALSSKLSSRKLTPHQANPPLAKSRNGVLSCSFFKGVVAAWYTGVAPSHVGANATWHQHSRITVNTVSWWLRTQPTHLEFQPVVVAVIVLVLVPTM